MSINEIVKLGDTFIGIFRQPPHDLLDVELDLNYYWHREPSSIVISEKYLDLIR
jgi:hypothetical protein